AGFSLLVESHWERRRDLFFSLSLRAAECEFLTGSREAAEARLAHLSQRALDTQERAAVACLQIEVYLTLDQGSRAVEVSLDNLRHLGIDWSPHPSEEDIVREYERTRHELSRHSTDDLMGLPLMVEESPLATLDVLTKLIPAALFSNVDIIPFTVC